MRLHVRVTPTPDESLTVTPEQIDAAQAWLEIRVLDGRFEMCLPFPETGGFVLLTLPTDDKAAALVLLREMFADYPLLDTIHMDVNVVLPTLRAGFDVLRAAQRRGVRTAEMVGS